MINISIIWISTIISILIIFIYLQNNQLYKDPLTNVFNRKQLDYYLSERLQKRFHKELLVGIMIDINSFKRINDIYGYDMGDQALNDMARILKNSFSKTDFIARYGADEFIVIVEVSDSSGLIRAINRLKENVNKFNQTKHAPYELDFCIGADYYNTRSRVSAQDFLKRIHTLLNQDKKEKENT